MLFTSQFPGNGTLRHYYGMRDTISDNITTNTKIVLTVKELLEILLLQFNNKTIERICTSLYFMVKTIPKFISTFTD